MIAAADFLEACHTLGLRFVTGTPCSYLRPLIDAAAGDERIGFRSAANEGDAVAMAAGAYAATGRPGVVMFQNSGLGNAVNALTSLNYPFRLPALLVVSHRGEQSGPADEPQHELMGRITTDLLDTLGIPWEPFPVHVRDVDATLGRAVHHFRSRSLPYALVVPRGAVSGPVSDRELDRAPIGHRRISFSETLPRSYRERCTRAQALAAVRAAAAPEDVILATTGYTGRELHALGDADNQLYLVGSMGSASSFALGLALYQPQRRVWLADGDGAALMRMGNLAVIGALAPSNLFHLVLDNEVHESTGGQATVSRGVSFGAIAQACGYPRAAGTDSLDELRRLLVAHGAGGGPTLLHFRIRAGTMRELGRPDVAPARVLARLMRHLEAPG